jgi:DNA polymerase-3 subunit alpha
MYSLDLNAVDNAVGLLKLDYLGLRTLSVVQDTVKLVKSERDIDIDIYKIPLDDPKVFETFQEGDTTGIFQMESSGYRQLNREMKPDRFEDISVMCALYRPGPMAMIPEYIERKKDTSKVSYPHNDLKEVLGDTYGIIAYQEQCLSIATLMAGYTVGRADLLRRAIGKKKKSLMEEEKKSFIKGAKEQGYTAAEAENVFDFIEKFAAYGFNRGHSASYGLLAYQTAYLKTHFPIEFYTALLSNEQNNTDKVALIISELKQKNIHVLPPDINKSYENFSTETLDDGEKAIRYGLAALKNVGYSTVEAVVKERTENGSYNDLLDLCNRVDHHILNAKAMESLIRSGALKAFGTISGINRVIQEYMEAGAKYQYQKSLGQNSLFGIDGKLYQSVSKIPQLENEPQDQLLMWEKEVFGFYFSDNPHSERLLKMKKYVHSSIQEIAEDQINKQLVVGGYVTKKSVVTTKKGNKEMAFLTITDDSGILEVIVFPDVYQNGARKIEEDSMIMVYGKIDQQDDGSYKLIANKLLIPEL